MVLPTSMSVCNCQSNTVLKGRYEHYTTIVDNTTLFGIKCDNFDHLKLFCKGNVVEHLISSRIVIKNKDNFCKPFTTCNKWSYTSIRNLKYGHVLWSDCLSSDENEIFLEFKTKSKCEPFELSISCHRSIPLTE